jgi:hypothetical protein
MVEVEDMQCKVPKLNRAVHFTISKSLAASAAAASPSIAAFLAFRASTESREEGQEAS